MGYLLAQPVIVGIMITLFGIHVVRIDDRYKVASYVAWFLFFIPLVSAIQEVSKSKKIGKDNVFIFLCAWIYAIPFHALLVANNDFIALSNILSLLGLLAVGYYYFVNKR